MSILELALSLSGKKDMRIDKGISSIYIVRLMKKYLIMALRGYMKSIFYKNISSDIFVGRNVKLLEKRNIVIGKKTKIHDNCKIDALSIEGVKIGNNVVLGERTTIECTGTIRSVGKGISIGEYTSFGSDCFFGAAGGIEIGSNVIAGQYIRFHSENHNYDDLTKLIREQGVNQKGIKIGSNCWIGSGAVFLDGVEIGDGCVVAANAVVNKSFPNNSIIGGVPAKIISIRK